MVAFADELEAQIAQVRAAFVHPYSDVIREEDRPEAEHNLSIIAGSAAKLVRAESDLRAQIDDGILRDFRSVARLLQQLHVYVTSIDFGERQWFVRHVPDMEDAYSTAIHSLIRNISAVVSALDDMERLRKSRAASYTRRPIKPIPESERSEFGRKTRALLAKMPPLPPWDPGRFYSEFPDAPPDMGEFDAELWRTRYRHRHER